ncbi:MAG: Segregation and condensation protein B [candidate division TA06 bacterium 32_111]|uniref:Segregation and condensation protein B n=2 Tax=Bacteria candidate phyla TaxID=1783234 RepID=A0A101I3E1_UNCT6|nr:MAG: Segregation and condensation protein B [candidate division TA06 bacterium 32_111]KUK88221.1 MAG: Segregation and condensation protein B [candidate division TA06 bacterium 34_109]HAF07154.1 SMC-Scp complex subunit ScpB [candidate division WOR-3 bacterium]HCP16005.1 SMC-Scp complex subunit ScpB [candidate division WOR-3 bacterium]
MERIIPQVEAILFSSSEPIGKDELAKALGIEKTLLMQVIEYLREKYSSSDSGIMIIEVASGYQLVTKPQFSEVLEQFFGNRKAPRLSTPALETLAIIAYKQPITKQEVEEIRGVNCDGVFKTLLDRELIMKRGNADLPGKPSLYHTTKKFLSYFKISSLKELPAIDDITTEKPSQEELFENKDQ